MTDWTSDFLNRSLKGIPDGPYRQRMEQELHDHLLSLTQTMEAGGHSSQEAQELTLARMGDPKEINRTYQEDWQRWQARTPRYCVDQFVLTFLKMLGVLCFFGLVSGLLGITADVTFAYRRSFSMVGHPIFTFVYGALLFLLPFSYGAYTLSQGLRWHPQRRALTCIGLVAAWLAGTTVTLLLLAGCYGGPFWDIPKMTDYACHGSEFNVYFFTTPYVVWTFLACVPLGLFFSQIKFDRKTSDTDVPSIEIQ